MKTNDYNLELDYLKDSVFKFNTIIPSYLINYLYSLLYLDIFAINKLLSNDDLEYLNKLSIYKNVVIYNIINYIKNMKTSDTYITNNSNSISLSYLKQDIITFNYHKPYTKNKNYIGMLILNDYQEKEGLESTLEEQINNVNSKINPYSKNDKSSYHLWQYEHLKELHNLFLDLRKVKYCDLSKLRMIDEYYQELIDKLNIRINEFTLIEDETLKRTLVKESSSLPMINYTNYR